MDPEEFICAIKGRPLLWMNLQCEDEFKNTIKKQWGEIKELFPLYSEDYLRKKWKRLKETFKKELIQIPNPESGDDSIVVESTWKYFKQLSFLSDEMSPTDDESETGFDEVQKPFRKKFKSRNFRNEGVSLSSSNSSVNLPLTTQRSTETPQLHSPTSRVPSSSTAKTTGKRHASNEIKSEYLENKKKKLREIEPEKAEN